jgi:hypothetical protein
MLIASALLTGLGLAAAMRWLLVPVSWWTAALVVVAVVLALPLGMLTIMVLPPPCGGTDYVAAVKVGYPIFWLNVLMGVASHVAVRRTRRQPVPLASPSSIG